MSRPKINYPIADRHTDYRKVSKKLTRIVNSLVALQDQLEDDPTKWEEFVQVRMELQVISLTWNQLYKICDIIN